jgi:hypothetical protein
MSCFRFLLVYLCTLGFSSYFSSKVTLFIHTSVVSLLLVIFSSTEDYSIESFHKSMSKTNAETKSTTIFVQ